MPSAFKSELRILKAITLPKFSNVRVMMLPVLLEDSNSLPDYLAHWKPTFEELQKLSDCKKGVAYLTIDEKTVQPKKSHRRSGLHVDGIYKGGVGGWGGGGTWGGNGMLTVSNTIGCRAWNQEFNGWPGNEGECDHLQNQLGEPIIFQPNVVYWLDGLCVHESISQEKTVERQFVRLSMPSNGPWFEGYTKNPNGIQPTGPILERRSFMDS